LKLDKHQKLFKSWFYKSSVSKKDIQVGHLVLKWDKSNEHQRKHTKFQQLYLGPFQIQERIGYGNFRLITLEGEIKELPVNGQILKKNTSLDHLW
jgi:hypothetical protein